MLFNKVKYPFLGEGNPKAKILIVTEQPNSEEHKSRKPIGTYKKEIFSRTAKLVGLKETEFFFINCTDEVLPIEHSTSEAKKKDHVIKHREKLIQFIEEFKPEIIVPLGKSATTALAGRSVKLNTVRGMIQDYELPAKVFPTKSIGEILRSPEQEQVLEIDLRAIKELKDKKWNCESIVSRFDGVNYRYLDDLQELIDLKPKLIAVDTETTGLMWYRPEVRAITIQAAYAEGQAICTIVNPAYDKSVNFDLQRKLISQWKKILENPEIKKVAHNLKYDHHILSKLGINVKGWIADTAMLAFAVDENQESFRQSDCVKRYVPKMAGYSDLFDSETDKSKMIEVPKEDMLKYACGDADTCLRLFNTLLPILKKDKKQYNLFSKVQMPALKAFIRMEYTGVSINTNSLKELEHTLRNKETELYESILVRISGELKRKYLDNLSLGRPAFLRDILFSDLGLKLKPVKFTKTTEKLKSAKDKVPSISTKQHLSHFKEIPLVADIIEYVKTTKIISTYIGDSEKDTGFYKWIYKNTIHPSFLLWGTVTGRTSSREPNGQNIPKHGDIAKSYRKIFEPREGYTLLEADLSQAELRYAAWMANDKEMLKVYKEGGDIHEATAAAVMGLTIEAFRELDEEIRDFKRQGAKGVNFGLVYTMTPESLVDYVKTNYGVEMTLEEARKAHKAYFKKYKNLLTWHEFMITTAKKLGYVRALHGAKRRLPAIHSREYMSSSEAERQAINTVIQRLASDSVLFALIRLNREANHDLVRPILFIHDSLVLEVKTELVVQLSAAIKWYMETPPFKDWFGLECPVPIISDAAIGTNLSEMKKLAKIKEADFKYKGLEDYFTKENNKYTLKAVKPDWKQLTALVN